MNKPSYSNSKAYIDAKTSQFGHIICIDKQVKIEKQVEALVEALVANIVSRLYKVELGVNSTRAKQGEMVVEALTYTIIKRIGLDVRTYCLSSDFEVLSKNSKNSEVFVGIVDKVYKRVEKMFIG